METIFLALEESGYVEEFILYSNGQPIYEEDGIYKLIGEKLIQII